MSNCKTFEDINSATIEHARSEILKPEFEDILMEDPNRWLASNNNPAGEFGSAKFFTFWTQMTRFNQTHFHNETSIFHQNAFNIPDFVEIVLSNEHGRLRQVVNFTNLPAKKIFQK